MTGANVPLISAGDDRTLRVSVDTRVVAQVIRRAPKVAHFWLQGFLSKSMIDHRVNWLRSKGTRFGRRGADGSSKAIKVYRVNEGPERAREEDVVYRVWPRNQKTSSVAQAVAGLKQMGAEAFAGSTVLRVHEFGEDIRSARLMAIPVKTRPKTPEKWVRANPSKKLEFRPSKTNPGEGVLYEVTQRRARGRGRPRKGAPLPALRAKLRLRFLLKRFVQMDPTLNFYGSWDAMRSKRDQLWKGAADRMARQLQRGDPRDF